VVSKTIYEIYFKNHTPPILVKLILEDFGDEYFLDIQVREL